VIFNELEKDNVIFNYFCHKRKKLASLPALLQQHHRGETIMSQTATAAMELSTQDLNKAVFRRYIDELWNEGRIEIIDEIMHDDLYCHPPSFQGDTYKADMPGIIEAFHKAFPKGGFTFVIEEMFAADDKVAVWLSFKGRQQDEFCGVPSSGKTLNFDVLGYYRFAEGRIIEVRKLNVGHNHDFISAMGIREQLGG
jgi:steroid delta-isomerase-like uncharacterized protein